MEFIFIERKTNLIEYKIKRISRHNKHLLQALLKNETAVVTVLIE
ncbi:hypothetical protein MCEMSEM29_01836 [Methylophilaceae bacterium]